MYYLFLDEKRQPRHIHWLDLPDAKWTIARNIEEFKEVVDEKGIPLFVSFGNDLTFEHRKHFTDNHCSSFDFDLFTDTGYHCAKYLVKKCLEQDKKIPSFECHSKNVIARSKIREYLRDSRKIILNNLNKDVMLGNGK